MSTKKDRGAKKPGRGKAADANANDDAGETGEASLLRRIWDQVGPIALAVLIALGIRATIIESYYVPSGSMLPTMFIGDHVFVSKFTFGSHIPFTDWVLPALREPERGEIVVFALGREPGGRRICPLDQCPGYVAEGFVKRIVGLPGDTIEFRKGQFYLNDALVETQKQPESFADDRGTAHDVLLEDLTGCRHEILDDPRRNGLPQVRITVPEDRYFVLGDNRDNSNDSRGWGTVHQNDLKGPVLFNYWAWNNRYSWPAMLNPITWVKLLWGEMYWDRIGMTYDCRSED